jgi:hypothetical protein
MALTAQDKRLVLNRLDELDRLSLDRITASQDAFERWLANRLPDIYRKVKAALQRAWDWFRSLFY